MKKALQQGELGMMVIKPNKQRYLSVIRMSSALQNLLQMNAYSSLEALLILVTWVSNEPTVVNDI